MSDEEEGNMDNPEEIDRTDEAIKKKLILRKLFKEATEKNIKECMDIITEELLSTENEIKINSTIDVIKKKSGAIKKLEQEIIEPTSDENLLEQMIDEGMEFEIYCLEKITTLSNKTTKNIDS